MKMRLFIYILIILNVSCASKKQINSSKVEESHIYIDFEKWKNNLLEAIDIEHNSLKGSLKKSEKLYYDKLKTRVQLQKEATLQSIIDTAYIYSTDIFQNSTLYMIEYYLSGETADTYYALLSKDDIEDKCMGVVKYPVWKWEFKPDVDCNNLTKLLELKTVPKDELKLFSSYMIISEFRNNELVNVKFTLKLSAWQVIIIEKLI